MVSQC